MKVKKYEQEAEFFPILCGFKETASFQKSPASTPSIS